LKQLPVPAMASIEISGISRQQSSHQACQSHISGSQKKMSMIGHQRPGITACVAALQQRSQSLDKPILISSISKYASALYPTDYYMLQYPGCI
jgi:hypothetical protein